MAQSMTNREFADEFFRVIEDGQFSEEAMDFVDALSRRKTKDPLPKQELTEKGIAFLRAFKKVYKGEPIAVREVTDSLGLQDARGYGGIVNDLVKKGFLSKGFKEGFRSYIYTLTEKGKNYSTERV